MPALVYTANQKEVFSRCITMTARNTEKLNIAIKKAVMETAKFRKTSQIWLEAFDALMRWFLRRTHSDPVSTKSI